MSKLNVVLDMDEMLVHAYKVESLHLETNQKGVLVNLRPPKKAVIKQYGETSSSKGQIYEVIVHFVKRPGLDEFLEQLVDLDVNVNIWTNSEKLYADAILNAILPEAFKGNRRYYRGECKVAKKAGGREVFYKDLRKYWGDEMDRTVIFDDNPNNFLVTPQNGYQAVRWEGNLAHEPSDYMSGIIEIIKELKDSGNVALAAAKLQEDFEDLGLNETIETPKVSMMGSFSGMAKSMFFK
mmetsp:Transcript_4783/g.5906  ORF Transcript_4783/g.5906 Transcript_4783/m.5906 type:complete len:238 (+) Transcript_4783:193-906(+)